MKGKGASRYLLVALLALAILAAMLFTWQGLDSGEVRSKHGTHGALELNVLHALVTG